MYTRELGNLQINTSNSSSTLFKSAFYASQYRTMFFLAAKIIIKLYYSIDSNLQRLFSLSSLIVTQFYPILLSRIVNRLFI